MRKCICVVERAFILSLYLKRIIFKFLYMTYEQIQKKLNKAFITREKNKTSYAIFIF